MVRVKFLMLFLLFFCLNGLSQTINFTSYKSNYGTIYEPLNIYVWGCWVQDSTKIIFDLEKQYVDVNGDKYEIIEKPTYWIVKKNFKYCIFMCADMDLNKVCIKIYEYDNSDSFMVYVNQEDKAKKYIVKKE